MMTESTKSPVNRRADGARGERIAAAYLEKKGFRLVCRNFKVLHGEIDLIMENDAYLVFVEVKTRTKRAVHSLYGTPGSAVTKSKQRHIIAAAREYLYRNPMGRDLQPRFDVVEVLLSELEGGFHTAEIHHIEGAFRL